MRIRIWTATAAGLVLLGLGGSAAADEKLIGHLTAVDADAKTISVQETGAAEATTFATDDKTQIREGRKDIDLATVVTGRTVKVTYVEQDGVALARRVEVSMPLGEDRSKTMPTRKDGMR